MTGCVGVGEQLQRVGRVRVAEGARLVRAAQELEQKGARPRAGRVVVEDRLEEEAADEGELLLVCVCVGQVGAALGKLLKEAVLRPEDLAPEGGVEVRG